MRQCIKCGAEITHHHKYCDKHYPQKTATILTLSNLNKRLKNEIYRKSQGHCDKCREKQKHIKKLLIKILNLENTISQLKRK